MDRLGTLLVVRQGQCPLLPLGLWDGEEEMAELYLPFRSTPGLASSIGEPRYLGGQAEAYKPVFVLQLQGPPIHMGMQSQVQRGPLKGLGLTPCLGLSGSEGVRAQSHPADGTVALWALNTPCPGVRVHLRARAGARLLADHHAGRTGAFSVWVSRPAHASWQRHC